MIIFVFIFGSEFDIIVTLPTTDIKQVYLKVGGDDSDGWGNGCVGD